MTDARGVELPDAGERRQEPESGHTLQTSLDVNIQMYATQGCFAGDGKETGGWRVDSDYETRKWRNPGHGECTGI